MPLREYRTFFRQFRQQFETTGAIAPSSRFLARAMARPLQQRDGAQLECAFSRSVRALEP